MKFFHGEVANYFRRLFAQPSDQLTDPEEIQTLAVKEIFILAQAERWAISVNRIRELYAEMSCSLLEQFVAVIARDTQVVFRVACRA
ncbi:MAG: hypothetical protein IPO17_04135 [Flavobacteriales bacterium]|nr:hypothetical protein [Flavobacteriales bacterium]